MTVFKDEDDGAAYLIYASARNKEMHISRLSEDYTDVENVTVRALIGMHGEAPAVFKHGGAAQAEGDRSVEGDGLAVAAKHMADGPRVGAECKADMPSANQAGRGMERVVPNRRAATLAVGQSRSGVGFEPVVAVEATRAGVWLLPYAHAPVIWSLVGHAKRGYIPTLQLLNSVASFRMLAISPAMNKD
ncbi:hypothetical protein SASPL_128805 [Salvia splendens]|uniref:Uncharacterized protein n=1 Tax=Salvia splendens TaxID=180675 RepID=A0A8X8XC87_SALSN|nr:hypothetical protein SASPL_128805 [Salvia splendens]